MTLLRRVILVSFISFTLFGASNSSLRNKGQTMLAEGFVAVPTMSTTLTSKSCVLFQLTVGNPTAGAITLSVSDRQGSPQNPINISIAANTVIIMSFPEGVRFKSGITWIAGGAGLTAEPFGFTDNN